MVQITGKFQQERSENLDEYFKAIGVPYIPRKMIIMSNPTVEIKQAENMWTIITSTMMRSTELKFKLGEEFNEEMPGGVLKSTITMDDAKLSCSSIHEDGTKISRIYEFADTEMILTLTHEKSGQVAKRYFKRL